MRKMEKGEGVNRVRAGLLGLRAILRGCFLGLNLLIIGKSNKAGTDMKNCMTKSKIEAVSGGVCGVL